MICNQTDPCFFNMLAGQRVVCAKPDIQGPCLEKRHNGQTIHCGEKNSCAYYVSNPKRLTVAVIRIDKYVIKDDPSQAYDKCDYLLLIERPGNPVAVLVELKKPKDQGNLQHAMKQLWDTWTALKSTLSKCKLYGRVVTPGNPQKQSKKAPKDELIQLKYYRELQIAMKKCGGDFAVRNPRGKTPVDSVTVAGNDVVLK